MKITLLIVFILAASAIPSVAQGPTAGSKTNSKILYHNGSVLVGATHLYVIWYGCWTNECGTAGSTNTTQLVDQLVVSIGSTPYAALYTLYPNAYGQAPSGSVLYGGSTFDRSYSHGIDLTEDDIKGIVIEHVDNNDVPPDPSGVYLVVASADVASNATGFCSTIGAPPIHGIAYAFYSAVRYGFVGNPRRCPSLEAPQFVNANGTLLPTPNGDFASDAMASNIARVVSNSVSNPSGDGWYDRYGLESADKCFGTFGQTYTTANGALANVQWGGRDYLIQQNWVNDRHPRCAMQLGR